MMQVSGTSRRSRSSESLAAQLDAHWSEVGRFITSRRLQSSVYAGAMGELSFPQLQALAVLAEDELRMSELASRLGIAESTATRLVDRLEAAKLVKRRASQPDRRCIVAALTPAGRRLAGELEGSRRQFLAEILETLRADERRELIRLFAKVTEALRDLEPRGTSS